MGMGWMNMDDDDMMNGGMADAVLHGAVRLSPPPPPLQIQSPQTKQPLHSVFIFLL
jgi:hypothetical protein